MPKLDSGCLSQFCNTVFTSMLCQIPVVLVHVKFQRSVPVYLVPSFMGLMISSLQNTVVGVLTGVRYIHSWAFTTLLCCILELNLKATFGFFLHFCQKISYKWIRKKLLRSFYEKWTNASMSIYEHFLNWNNVCIFSLLKWKNM